MDKKQKLSRAKRVADLRENYRGLKGWRDTLVKSTNNRAWRKREVMQVIQRIRALRKNLDEALDTLRYLRSASDCPQGAIYTKIDFVEERLKQLRKQIALANAELHVERLLKLKAQLDALDPNAVANILAKDDEEEEEEECDDEQEEDADSDLEDSDLFEDDADSDFEDDDFDSEVENLLT